VPAIQYWLGVINGSGPNAVGNQQRQGSVYQNSAQRAGQLRSPPERPVARVLRLQRVEYSQRYHHDNNTITNTTGQIVSSSSAATVSHNGPKERWGADLAYVNTPVGFTLEYVHGRDLVAAAAPSKMASDLRPVSPRLMKKGIPSHCSTTSVISSCPRPNSRIATTIITR